MALKIFITAEQATQAKQAITASADWPGYIAAHSADKALDGHAADVCRAVVYSPHAKTSCSGTWTDRVAISDIIERLDRAASRDGLALPAVTWDPDAPARASSAHGTPAGAAAPADAAADAAADTAATGCCTVTVLSMEGRLQASMRPGFKPLSLADEPPQRLVASVATETGFTAVMSNLTDVLTALDGRRVRIAVETLDD